jgi:hypothetical protein
MSPTTQVIATKKPVVQPKRPKSNPPKTSKRAWTVNSGIVVSDVVSNVAQFASLPGVKLAAEAVSTVFVTIEKVQANKEDFQIIADDAADLIIAIWRHQENSENPEEWAKLGIRDLVTDLKTALEDVNRIAMRQATRNMVVRVIFHMTDAGQIRRTREKIASAQSKFQVLCGMKIIDLLLQFAKKQEEDPPKQTTTAPAFVNSISNGSGNMVNIKVGNFDNNITSNVGNNNSTNYYGYPG